MPNKGTTNVRVGVYVCGFTLFNVYRHSCKIDNVCEYMGIKVQSDLN